MKAPIINPTSVVLGFQPPHKLVTLVMRVLLSCYESPAFLLPLGSLCTEDSHFPHLTDSLETPGVRGGLHQRLVESCVLLPPTVLQEVASLALCLSEG